jgi:hypothetical protein
LICLGGLFLGIFAWGKYVTERDRVRRASDALVLQRGDLATEFEITPSTLPDSALFTTLIHSTGAHEAQAVIVQMNHGRHFHAEVLYLTFATPAQAAAATQLWRKLLGIPATQQGATTPYISPQTKDQATFLWRDGPLLLAAQGDSDPHLLSKVTAAVDARVQRWLQQQGKK